MPNSVFVDVIARPSLKIIAIAVVALCAAIKFKTGGWFILVPGMVFYPVVGFLHYYAHSRAIQNSRSIQWPLLVLIGASHVLLILAFLLQYDVGDGLGWLTITALIGDGPGYPNSEPPAWWPSIPFLSLWVFVPVFVTWRTLLKKGTQGSAKVTDAE